MSKNKNNVLAMCDKVLSNDLKTYYLLFFDLDIPDMCFHCFNELILDRYPFIETIKSENGYHFISYARNRPILVSAKIKREFYSDMFKYAYDHNYPIDYMLSNKNYLRISRYNSKIFARIIAYLTANNYIYSFSTYYQDKRLFERLIK